MNVRGFRVILFALTVLSLAVGVNAQKQSSVGTQATPVHVAAAPAASPNFGGFFTAPFYNNGPLFQSSQNSGFLSADINQDGYPDLVSVTDRGDIYVSLNDGKGGFRTPVVTSLLYAGLASSFMPGTPLAADLNGDGYPDLVIANDLDGKVQLLILLNQQNNTFAAPIALPLPTIAPLFPAYLPNNLSIAVGKTSTTGHQDIVSAESYPSTGTSGQAGFTTIVQTFVNDGTAKFPTQKSVSYFVAGAGGVENVGSSGTALADVNRDGNVDLLLVRDGAASSGIFVDVLTGNGDGSFLAPVTSASVVFPWTNSSVLSAPQSDLAVASLTGDPTRQDIVLSNGSGVYIALSNGNGTYQVPVQVAQSALITGVQLADLNGDSKPDLVVDEVIGMESYLGKGDGTFGPIAAAVLIGGGSTRNIWHVAIADFNNDHKLDFASDFAGESNVEIALGNGDGTFVATPLLYSETFPVFPPSSFFAQLALDLNGDGYTDLLGIAPDSIMAGLGNGNGGFTYKTALSKSTFPTSYLPQASGDFNGDGKTDAVLIGTDGTAAVALSNGDGTLSFAGRVPLGTTLKCELDGAAVGDVNGDKKVDLVFIYSGDSYCGQNSSAPAGYFVLLGNGDGTFQTATFTSVTVPVGTLLFDVKLAPFHGSNGPLDMLLQIGNSAYLLQGDGHGGFGALSFLHFSDYISPILTDDFNQDGKADITLLALPDSGEKGGIVLLAGNGDGTFAAPQILDPGSSSGGGRSFYADLNGDGIPDLVAEEGTDLSVFLGTGGGNFAQPLRYFSPWMAPWLTGNFLGDNVQSVIASNGLGGTAFFMNQGGTKFSISASATSIVVGQSVTLSAVLAPTPIPQLATRPSPTGTISIYDGTTLIGSGSPSSASVTTATLAVGTHSISATYAGDTNYNPNRAAAVMVTVTAAPPPTPPDFTVTSTASSLSISRGSSGTLPLTVAANAAVANATIVTFACGGLPSAVSCSFSPATLGVNPGDTKTSTVTITTTSASSAAFHPYGPVKWSGAGGLSLAGLVLLVFPRKRALWKTSMLIAGFVVLAVSGCGGGGNTTTPINPGTPTGTSNVMVTTTAVSGSTTMTHTLTISMTVK